MINSMLAFFLYDLTFVIYFLVIPVCFLCHDIYFIDFLNNLQSLLNYRTLLVFLMIYILLSYHQICRIDINSFHIICYRTLNFGYTPEQTLQILMISFLISIHT